MSSAIQSADADAIALYDRRDPDPWLALYLDSTLPIANEAKKLLLRSQGSRSRQFLLPLIRPMARLSIILVQLLRIVTPRELANPKLLHRLMVWGMKRFVRPDANALILRHFNLGREILAFIADNATPGFRPELDPIAPTRIDDLADNVFLKHDLNIYNFLIQLNHELERRGTKVEARETLDFSAITDGPALEPLPSGRLNRIDLHSAIEFYTPLYGLFLTDRDFWRASNSLQLDETVGLYAARLTGREHYLAFVNNRHPMVPFSTMQAGFRLMLHGLSTELLHGFLREMKHAAGSGAAPVRAMPAMPA